MEVTIALRLPRDAASAPVIRQMLDSTLRIMGVEEPVRDDIQLMLSEACSNVIRHAAPSDEYTVSVDLIDDKCVIQVVDRGHGFDSRQLQSPSVAADTAEHGRGMQIMRALADDVRFGNQVRPGAQGAVVRMEKTLSFANGTPGRTLSSAH